MTIVKRWITSDDPKGRKATDLFRGVYDKAGLTDEKAQRLNENRGSEFTTELAQLIQKHSLTDQYKDEVVSSDYTYPSEYKPKSIEEKIKAAADIFGLDPKSALELAKNLPELPNHAEAWFAIPKLEAVAKKHFPSITDPAEQYCEAVNMVLEKLADSRGFYNYRKGQITSAQLRQSARTAEALSEMGESQSGDILIVAAQFGMRHRGKSVRRARETFSGNEFGLGAFAMGCMALVHPERYVKWEQLHTDCAGDEFAPDADGAFSRAPIFVFFDELEFGTSDVSDAADCYGSVSGFLPQG